jgi:phosphate transporter
MLIPFLVVVLRVLRSPVAPHTRLTAKEAAPQILACMFSPVIMLLLGGFTLAAALSRHKIAQQAASWILAKVGSGDPHRVVGVMMFIATFSSMWISNVAAPVLCFELLVLSFELLVGEEITSSAKKRNELRKWR